MPYVISDAKYDIDQLDVVLCRESGAMEISFSHKSFLDRLPVKKNRLREVWVNT
jgi:hypothetical protein